MYVAQFQLYIIIPPLMVAIIRQKQVVPNVIIRNITETTHETIRMCENNKENWELDQTFQKNI